METAAKQNTYLYQYYTQCKMGAIIIGRELMHELDKLIDDMDDERYRYETERAHMRIDFMQQLCFQSKKPFYMQPIQLLLWEKAFLEVIYSFKYYSDECGRWILRFQDVLLLVARKNGKTTLMAADGHTDLRIGDGGMDIVCASNDDKQASLIWNEINGMRKCIDPKSKWTHKNNSEISNKGNGTKIFKLSSKTQNKDGRNIDKTYNDESHDAKDDEIAAACQKSMSVKDEPMFINLTTEGFVVDGYLDNKLIYARKVLNDEIEDINFLPWLYTQDSEGEIWRDENSWYKSNPSLGAVKKFSYLRRQVEASKVDQSTKIHTLCKDFNFKQNSVQSWLSYDKYHYDSKYEIDDLYKSICLGAVDLAQTTDLVSAKIFTIKQGKKYIISHYWITENKLKENDDHEEGAKYKDWAQDDLLTIVHGNDIDLSIVAKWFHEMRKEYKLRIYKVGYDVKFSTEFLRAMDAYHFDCEMILQNKETLTNAIKLTEADLRSKIIMLNNNEVDLWCLGNAALEVDDLGKCLVVKPNKIEGKKIDGAVTLVMCNEMYKRHRFEIYRKEK
ncbi:terminase large subunit [[Clostridium] innocuum]|nr:terminase large subunit [[Clostridium] innocuum]